MKKMKRFVVSAKHVKLQSAVERCGKDPHVHVYFQSSEPISRNAFPPKLLESHWLKPVYQQHGDSIHKSVAKYLNYMKNYVECQEEGEAVNWIALKEQNRAHQQNKTQQVKEMIMRGERRVAILKNFPQMQSQIAKLMELRPPRTFHTYCLHLYGPTGTGKTARISKTLEALKQVYPDYDYYSKMGGLSRFWDGYDNQLICWIDDPVMPDSKQNSEGIQQMKTVVASSGPVEVQIKFGSMQFDSKLIISCNTDPRQMANRFGKECFEPMMRRFSDPPGNYRIQDRDAAIKSIVYIT